MMSEAQVGLSALDETAALTARLRGPHGFTISKADIGPTRPSVRHVKDDPNRGETQ